MRKKKIILSRKGFDSSAGGKASPILNNKFISLPIPRSSSDVFYKNLFLDSKTTYLDIMQDLNIHYFSEAHLDPDLRHSTLSSRPKDWRGLFGQSHTAQSSLLNEGITKGDIFLFFGWFREIEKRKNKFYYKKDAPNIHSIFGYLEVDTMIDLHSKKAVPNWALYHPHVQEKYRYARQKNGLYIATKHATFSPDKAGWGCFKFDEKLILTKPGQEKRSVWNLPPEFEGEESKFKAKVNLTSLQNKHIQVEFSGRNNQEIYISDNEKIVQWAETLIKTCKTYD